MLTNNRARGHQSANKVLWLDGRYEQALENAFAPVLHNVETTAGDADRHQAHCQQAWYYKRQVVLRAGLHVFDTQLEHGLCTAQRAFRVEQPLIQHRHDQGEIAHLGSIDDDGQVGRCTVVLKIPGQHQRNLQFTSDHHGTQRGFIAFDHLEERIAAKRFLEVG
jgi:hypothetical protein